MVTWLPTWDLQGTLVQSGKPVRSNQKALSCDSCTLWTHCKCASISNNTYNQYQKRDTLFWMCPRCLASSLPFNDCSAISTDMNLSSTQDSSSSSLAWTPPFLAIFLITLTTIHVAHLNVRSLLSVIDDVIHMIISEGVDVLAITEKWLDKMIADSEVCPNGYNIYRNDRNRKGGGVAFIVSNQL